MSLIVGNWFPITSIWCHHYNSYPIRSASLVAKTSPYTESINGSMDTIHDSTLSGRVCHCCQLHWLQLLCATHKACVWSCSRLVHQVTSVYGLLLQRQLSTAWYYCQQPCSKVVTVQLAHSSYSTLQSALIGQWHLSITKATPPLHWTDQWECWVFDWCAHGKRERQVGLLPRILMHIVCLIRYSVIQEFSGLLK